MYRLNRKKIACFIFGLVLLGGVVILERVFFTEDTYGAYKAAMDEKLEADGETEDKTEKIEKTEKTEKTGKCAYLTFDDGPSDQTEKVLDILKEEGVTATFFLIGEQINEETCPFVQRMLKEGHQVGVHTQCHEQSIYNCYEAWKKDFDEGFCTIENCLKICNNSEDGENIKITAARFPWGSTNGYLAPFKKRAVKHLEELGVEYFDWNVSAEDSIGSPTRESILQNVKKDYGKFTHPVVLMHDSHTSQKTVDVLPEIISMLKQDGYAFGTLDEMEEPFHYK